MWRVTVSRVLVGPCVFALSIAIAGGPSIWVASLSQRVFVGSAPRRFHGDGDDDDDFVPPERHRQSRTSDRAQFYCPKCATSQPFARSGRPSGKSQIVWIV